MNTSFPTLLSENASPFMSFSSAPQFDKSIAASEVICKLDAITLYGSLSLCVHFPPHSRLFWVGVSKTQIRNQKIRPFEYIDALIREISLVGQMLNGRGQPKSVHFRGDIQSYLAWDDLHNLLGVIESEVGLTDSANLAIDLDPRRLCKNDIGHLVSLGFERFGLDIQDFDPIVQRSLNRIQSFELIESCVSDIRAAGVDDLSFNILYGLPSQSEKGFDATIDKAIALSPDRISVCEHRAAPNQQLTDPLRLPDKRLRGELSALADEKLVDAGYRRRSFDDYAKPEYTHVKAFRGNRLKKSLFGFIEGPASTSLGFGLSAISSIDGLYSQNCDLLGDYIRQIKRGNLPTGRSVKRTKREREIAAAIYDLFCTMETNISKVLCGSRPSDAVRICSVLGKLEADGIIQWRGDIIKVVDSAHAVARAILVAVYPHGRPDAEFTAAV